MKFRMIPIGFTILLIYAGWTGVSRGVRYNEITDDTVRIQRNLNGRLSASVDLTGPSICPMNVPVGQNAVKFSGEVSTTNPNGVSYQVQIRHSSGTTGGTLENSGLEANIGSWEVSPGTGETFLLLSATVTPAQPLTWAAALIAGSAGPVFYQFQTYLNGNLSRNETCTFDIVQPTASFWGTVFLDIDSDGEQQSNEPGLPGRRVYVDENGNREYDDGSDPNTLTDGDGQFMFDNQPLPADLGMVVTQGWEQTFPVGGFHTIGEDGEEANFGERPADGAIFGAKWEDRNRDGRLNAGDEPLLPGWTIYIDSNDNNMLDSGEQSVLTDEFGRYAFTDLEPGTYVVREVQQDRFRQTYPAEPDEHTVILGEGQIAAGQSFGNKRVSSIHGQVFIDANGDGRRQATEEGRNTVLIFLSKPSGLGVDRTLTASMEIDGEAGINPVTEQGLYWFKDLDPGEYVVSIAVPDFNRQTTPTHPEEYTVTLGDEKVDSLDFGISTTALVSGTKYIDKIGGERMNDITIIITGEGREDSTKTAGVDAEGKDLGQYSFVVPSGRYVIRELLPAGSYTIYPERFYSHDVVLNSGEVEDSLDFVNVKAGSIVGRKFEDVNGNGLFDEGEKAFNGWTIELDGPFGRTTTTASLEGTDGSYSFDDLRPGGYSVSEVQQDGFRRISPRYRYRHVTVDPGGVELVDFFNQPVAVEQITDSGDGEGLRQAIEESNARAREDPPRHIKVDGGGQQNRTGKNTGEQRINTIRPTTPLPAITRPAIIDGGGTLILDGSDAGDGADGLVISGAGIDIVGLTITNFQGNGIVLNGDGNRILNSVVSHNGGNGIRHVSGSTNLFAGTSVFNNGEMSIDLGGDGPTANDPDESDGIQNYPVINSVANDTALVIQSTFNSKPDTVFVLEFFASTACDPSGSGQAEVFLGSIPVFTDSLGSANFTASFDTTIGEQQFISATATAPDGSTSEFSPCFDFVSGILADNSISAIPEKFTLYQNYPNPFNPTTTIRFDLHSAATVTLVIYDIRGREVARPVDGELPEGKYKIDFEGSGLASGIYLYYLEVDGFTQARKLTLLK